MALKIRASSLPNLLSCPTMWKEKNSGDGNQLGGSEAQTGNLVHCAMNMFHSSKKRTVEERVQEALAFMRDRKEHEFTGGDLATAESLFRSWCLEEIKASKGTIIATEIELSYKWPIFYSAAEYSAYREAKAGKKPIPQEEVTITGHIDEIRQVGEFAFVCDEKTGWTAADKMVGYYAAQLAAYTVGVRQDNKLLEKVPQLAGITKLRAYVKRTRDLQNAAKVDPYYYRIIESYEQAEDLMLVIGLRLGEIAQGVFAHTPGEHCRFCPLATFPDCLAGKLKPPGFEASGESKYKKPGSTTRSNSVVPLQQLSGASLPGAKPKSTF